MVKRKKYAEGDVVKPEVSYAGAPEGAGDEGIRSIMPFVADVGRQKIGAAMVGPQAAGTKSGFNTAGFYDAFGEARGAGRQVAGQQQGLANALLARSEGRGGPSIAEMQLQRTLEANKRAAAGALAGAGRGINPALAQRLLLQQQAGLSQEAAGQGALLRAQEQLAAQNALAGVLGQMRGAEQAQLTTAGQLGLGQEKLGVETQEAQTNRMLEIALANQKAEQERQRLQQIQENQAYEQVRAGRQAAPGMIGNLIGGIAKAVIGGGAAQGGMVQNYAQGGKVSKAKLIAAHAAAKKNMGAFKEQYGKEEGKDIAYATMMKMAKENKLALGGISDGSEQGLLSEPLGKLPIVGGLLSKVLGIVGLADGGEAPEKAEMRKALEKLFAEAAAEESKRLGGKVVTYKDKNVVHAVGRGSESKDSSEYADIPAKLANNPEFRKIMAAQTTDDERKATLWFLKKQYDEGKEIKAYEPPPPMSEAEMDELQKERDAEWDRKHANEKSDSFVGPPTPKGMASGGKVKAAMGVLAKMDNEANDTVPAMLSPGEIVLPRSVVSSPNAPLAASKFVAALLAKKDKKQAKTEALKAALTKKK